MACAAALKETQTADAWGIGAQAGLAAIQHYGGAKPGDRTMLDALAPAIETFRAKSRSGHHRTHAFRNQQSVTMHGMQSAERCGLSPGLTHSYS